MNESITPHKSIPNIQFSHLGICVKEIRKMTIFYTDVLGMTITDEGSIVGLEVVFLSRDPNDHHQVVLTTGRPDNIPENTANTMFGPVINQISFKLNTLDELKAMYKHLIEAYEADYSLVNHGTAWSIYFPDPEGNPIEVFVNSEWYVTQPVFEELNLSLDNALILESTRKLCESGEGFRPASEWKKQISVLMDARSS